MKIRRLLLNVYILAVLFALIQFSAIGAVLKFFAGSAKVPLSVGEAQLLLRFLVYFILGLSIFFLLLLATFGTTVVKQISRGCRELETAAEEVGKGNLDYRVTYSSKNELGVVATRLNHMVGRLKDSE